MTGVSDVNYHTVRVESCTTHNGYTTVSFEVDISDRLARIITFIGIDRIGLRYLSEQGYIRPDIIRHELLEQSTLRVRYALEKQPMITAKAMLNHFSDWVAKIVNDLMVKLNASWGMWGFLIDRHTEIPLSDEEYQFIKDVNELSVVHNWEGGNHE